MGAIDGTHIKATPAEAERARYRDRKGDITLNVLAACNFNMEFVYVLAGWEGSAADSFLYSEARDRDYVVPEGKYLLGDAGFPACDDCLVPYRNVRYHLREWEASGLRCVINSLYHQSQTNIYRCRPSTPKELFNLRHSQLRNIIERIFGVAKKKFKVLKEEVHFPMEVQSRLVSAVCVLFNVIKMHDPDDIEELDRELEASDVGNGVAPSEAPGGISQQETARGVALRERITQAMWQDYVAELERRGERVL